MLQQRLQAHECVAPSARQQQLPHISIGINYLLIISHL